MKMNHTYISFVIAPPPEIASLIENLEEANQFEEGAVKHSPTQRRVLSNG